MTNKTLEAVRGVLGLVAGDYLYTLHEANQDHIDNGNPEECIDLDSFHKGLIEIAKAFNLDIKEFDIDGLIEEQQIEPKVIKMANSVKSGLGIYNLRQDAYDFVMNVRNCTTSKWDYIIYGIEVLTFEGSQTFEFLITDGKCKFDDIQYIVSDYILDETDFVLKYVSATVMTLREVPIFKTHKVKDTSGLWKFFQTVQKGISDKIRGTIEGQATVYVKVFTDSEYARYINTDGVITLKDDKVITL